MKKFIAIITAMVLTMSIVGPVATSAAESTNEQPHQENNINTVNNPLFKNNEDLSKGEIINEMAEQFEFLYEEAAILDEHGEIVSIDMNKIEKKYGAVNIDMNNAQGKYGSEPYFRTLSADPFTKCIIHSTGSIIGVDVVKRAYNKEVKKALKSKAYKKASSIFYENIKKVLGKKGTKWLIKKTAGIALPGGLPGKFALMFAKCGAKVIF